MQEKDRRIETIVLAVSFVVLVAANALGEIFKFGGVTAADVSNEVFAWFAPAGYVFSIWSVIYIGLAVWIVRLIKDEGADQGFAGLPIGIEAVLFAASCVLNIAWLALWHLKVFAATIPVIIALLVVVAILYLLTWQRSESPLDRIPPAIYASWLAVATVANIAHVATRAATADAGIAPALSTIILLLVFVGLAFAIRRVFNDYVFGIVVAWAGIGIGVRLVEVSPLVGVIAILISTIGVAAALLPWDRLIASSRGNQRSSRASRTPRSSRTSRSSRSPRPRRPR